MEKIDVDTELVGSHLKCEICTEGIKDRVLNCGHSLCGSCLKSNTTSKCAFCRERITRVAKNFAIIHLAESLNLGDKVCKDSLVDIKLDEISDESSTDSEDEARESDSERSLVVYGEEDKLKVCLANDISKRMLRNSFDYSFPSTILSVKCCGRKILCCCLRTVFLFEHVRLSLKLIFKIEVGEFVYGLFSDVGLVVVEKDRDRQRARFYVEAVSSKTYELRFDKTFDRLVAEPFECHGNFVFFLREDFMLWNALRVETVKHNLAYVYIASCCVVSPNCFYVYNEVSYDFFEFEFRDNCPVYKHCHQISSLGGRPLKLFPLGNQYFGLWCYKKGAYIFYIFKKKEGPWSLQFKKDRRGDSRDLWPVKQFSPLGLVGSARLNYTSNTTLFVCSHGNVRTFGKLVGLNWKWVNMLQTGKTICCKVDILKLHWWGNSSGVCFVLDHCMARYDFETGIIFHLFEISKEAFGRICSRIGCLSDMSLLYFERVLDQRFDGNWDGLAESKVDSYYYNAIITHHGCSFAYSGHVVYCIFSEVVFKIWTDVNRIKFMQVHYDGSLLLGFERSFKVLKFELTMVKYFCVEKLMLVIEEVFDENLIACRTEYFDRFVCTAKKLFKYSKDNEKKLIYTNPHETFKMFSVLNNRYLFLCEGNKVLLLDEKFMKIQEVVFEQTPRQLFQKGPLAFVVFETSFFILNTHEEVDLKEWWPARHKLELKLF